LIKFLLDLLEAIHSNTDLKGVCARNIAREV